jgi:hypothetical protein
MRVGAARTARQSSIVRASENGHEERRVDERRKMGAKAAASFTSPRSRGTRSNRGRGIAPSRSEPSTPANAQ